MANHNAAKKAHRQSLVRKERNIARKSGIKTAIKAVEQAIEAGDAKAAQEAFKDAQASLAKGVNSGIFKKNTVARATSRLNARIKQVATKK